MSIQANSTVVIYNDGSTQNTAMPYPGTINTVLTSAGPGQTPVWTSAASGVTVGKSIVFATIFGT
jgi:hypothetical protein